MKVSLHQVDGDYPNLALMKLGAHHRLIGDQVSLFSQMDAMLDPPDRLYVAKVFDFTPDLTWWPEGTEIIRGGTGYDRGLVGLPAPVESMMPAYDFFGVDYAMGFTSRGCVNQCPFCLVPEKEGRPRVVADLDDFWTGQTHVRILDPNLTALPDHFNALLQRLAKERVITDLNQGLDARLLTRDQAELLMGVRLWSKYLHLAWDRMPNEAAVRRAIGYLKDAGHGGWKIMVYVLVGYDTTPEQDLYRIDAIRAMGCIPWVMPFSRPDESSAWKAYITAVKRWGSRPQFKAVPFQDYYRGQWVTSRDLPLVAGYNPMKAVPVK